MTVLRLSSGGIGESLGELQGKINHVSLDETIIAEMYSRPFWYMLNTVLPPGSKNKDGVEKRHNDGRVSGRILATSSPGPFGKLDPPSLADISAYHASLVRRVSDVTGIPPFFLSLSSGAPPSGRALQIMMSRFITTVSQMRADIDDAITLIASACDPDAPITDDSHHLWPQITDAMQDIQDTHGMAVASMGLPPAVAAREAHIRLEPGDLGEDWVD